MYPLRSRRRRSEGLAVPHPHLPLPNHPDALRWAFFWIAVFVVGGVFDYWRSRRHDGSTLSETLRYVFQIDSVEGKAFFVTFLDMLHVVLKRHILK